MCFLPAWRGRDGTDHERPDLPSEMKGSRDETSIYTLVMSQELSEADV